MTEWRYESWRPWNHTQCLRTGTRISDIRPSRTASDRSGPTPLWCLVRIAPTQSDHQTNQTDGWGGGQGWRGGCPFYFSTFSSNICTCCYFLILNFLGDRGFGCLQVLPPSPSASFKNDMYPYRHASGSSQSRWLVPCSFLSSLGIFYSYGVIQVQVIN